MSSASCGGHRTKISFFGEVICLAVLYGLKAIKETCQGVTAFSQDEMAGALSPWRVFLRRRLRWSSPSSWHHWPSSARQKSPRLSRDERRGESQRERDRQRQRETERDRERQRESERERESESERERESQSQRESERERERERAANLHRIMDTRETARALELFAPRSASVTRPRP